MSEPLKILSLGAGVQSSTVLLMSCLGELPKLDCAIFADTGWEPQEVYQHLGWLQGEAERHGIPVYRVSKGNIREDGLRAYLRKEDYDAANLALETQGVTARRARWANLPYFTLNPDGTTGKTRRQCTKEYKIEPIERQIRKLLGLRPRQPWPKEPVVEQWFGISVEEQRRCRLSEARWKTHRYPLIFDLPKAYTRHDCLRWLQERGQRQAPRSSCKGCPFHSDDEWRAIKSDPDAWADVTEFDAAIRNRGGMRGQLFLHRSCVPLIQVDLSTPEDHGQGSLWKEECLGYCGS